MREEEREQVMNCECHGNKCNYIINFSIKTLITVDG
jgi:hypothetical protein